MPRYGFNFQWMMPQPGNEPAEPDEKALDFLAAYHFDFVRLPTNYRVWTPDFDYFHPHEEYFTFLDRALAACRARGIHLSLNMHRVPGYCINGNDQEKHNLWLDKVAQDGFTFQWEKLTRHFLGIPASVLSFDLVNEPPTPGQYGMTREIHAAIIRRVAAAIRAIDPNRPISIDGLDGGYLAMPEFADLGATHSGRGYAPHAISHYKATWWPQWQTAPEHPVWPGLNFDGKIWNRDTLREVYRPWKDVQSHGVEIHIGEMGCYNQLPNEIALAWFADLLGVFREYEWGFAFWNFAGPFGIVDHGRVGAHFETLHGYSVDRDLLELIQANRVS